MKIKHTDLEIPKDAPFTHCKLGREQYAKVLTDVVKTYSDGFVISLNKPWGTGKTTFIKMWKAYLEKEGYKSIYFNAWENDFDNNPLVALMSELESLTGTDKSKFKSLIDKAAILSKNILPGLLKALASKYIDTEVALEVINDTTKGATEILEKEIKTYSEKKKGLCDFRDELFKYVSESIETKPLVWIIDELDRCRPNYSVEVLEQIKHFFSVPGIVFVLSIDKEQLGNAVRGLYGSENMNSNEYLRRFIDLEFVLPDPKNGVFTRYLFDYYGFEHYFFNKKRRQYFRGDLQSEEFLNFAIQLFENTNLSLRQQEKIFAHARMTLNSFAHNHYFFPKIFVFLNYVRDFHPDFFKKLENRSYSPQALLNDLKAIMPDKIIDEKPRAFLDLEALLVRLYHNYFKEINYGSEIVKEDDQSNRRVLINPIFDDSVDKKEFLRFYDEYERRNGGDVSLNHFLEKISLFSNFQVTSDESQE